MPKHTVLKFGKPSAKSQMKCLGVPLMYQTPTVCSLFENLQKMHYSIIFSPKHNNPWLNGDKKTERSFLARPTAYNSQWLIV